MVTGTIARASRWWALSALATLAFGCELTPVVAATSSDASVEVGSTPVMVADGPVLERIFSPAQRDTIGRICATDVDCPLLKCVKPTDVSMGGGGPAHGYCSTPCSAADSVICTVAGGACLNFAPEGAPAQNWCVQTCRRGGAAPDGGTGLDMNKCRGRTDVACTPQRVSNGQLSIEGYCLPTCNSDAECGARRCDPGSGVCVDAFAGDPTGAACSIARVDDGGSDANGDETVDGDTDAGITDDDAADTGTAESGDVGSASSVAPSGCAGVCLTVAATHVCAQRCTYGSPTACHLPTGPVDAGVGAYSACVFVSLDRKTGPGDEAHCGQLCDSAADCLDQVDPGVFCNTSDTAMAAFGHGYCDWSLQVNDAAAGDP